MDGGAKHTRDSGNPHDPGTQAGMLTTSPHFLWAQKQGEGIFIISDINNSMNSVEIGHLEINHSVQHKASGFTSQLQSCLKAGKAPRR